jgi:hypothetical protein
VIHGPIEYQLKLVPSWLETEHPMQSLQHLAEGFVFMIGGSQR